LPGLTVGERGQQLADSCLADGGGGGGGGGSSGGGMRLREGREVGPCKILTATSEDSMCLEIREIDLPVDDLTARLATS